MKKSEKYRLAQLSVMKDNFVKIEDKLEIIRELQENEGRALFIEKREEENNESN